MRLSTTQWDLLAVANKHGSVKPFGQAQIASAEALQRQGLFFKDSPQSSLFKATPEGVDAYKGKYGLN